MSQSIIGKVAAFAGGIVMVLQSATRASIDEQGNFSVPVISNPSSQTVKLFPPLGSPYAPLSLSVTIGPGATDITAQISGALSIVGSHIGIPSSAYIGTDANGNAVPASAPGGGTVTAVTGTAPISSSGGATPAISVGTATTGALGVVKPDGSSILISAGVISLGAIPNTSGAPVTTPALGTAAFDPTTNTLYIYGGAGWKATILV